MIPVMLLMSAGVALGLWMAWKFLRKRPSNPMVIGFHLILGLASLEAAAMLTRRGLDGQLAGAAAVGKYAALVLALAVITGFAVSIFARRWKRMAGGSAVATHGVLGLLGFVMFLAWALNL